MHPTYLTDGGICSNLPVFLFERERRSNNLPVLAFDLIVPERETSNSDYKLFKFSEDLLMTAMESSDKLLQGLITGLHYIPVKVPKGIDTLKFSLSRDEQTALFGAGYAAASHYFDNDVKHWFSRGADRITEIRAQRSVRPDTIEGLLAVIAKDFEMNTSAMAVRCYIMLPSGGDTQMVAYQYGMTGQADADWEIGLRSGWSGKALSKRQPVVADLTGDAMGLSVNERAKIPVDRKAALSMPLFDVSSSISGKIDASEDKLLGTLNIDTATELRSASWGTMSASPGRAFEWHEIVRERCLLWGEIFSRLLS
jgi:NTE family protein